MKQFIYFFKHLGIDAIKIGKTSGNDVLERFNCFKTYSPFGAEILGYYEVEDGLLEERKLHRQFADFRLSGEFFSISKDQVENVLTLNSKEYSLAVSIVNELILAGKDVFEIKKLYDKLGKNNLSNLHFPTPAHKGLYNNLDEKFSLGNSKYLLERYGIKYSTFSNYVKSKEGKLFSKIGHGIYQKIY